MEEVIINEPSLLQVLFTNPMTYIVLVIIAFTIVELKKQKSSSKCCKPNKTLSKGKPKSKVAPKKQVAKRKPITKKPTPKKVAKKTATKRTPKKSGTKN